MQSTGFFFKIGTFSSALHVRTYVGLRRWGGNISVDLSLFVLLYKTNFMNKQKTNIQRWPRVRNRRDNLWAGLVWRICSNRVFRPGSNEEDEKYRTGITEFNSVVTSVVDPDPNWSHIQQLCESGSVFGICLQYPHT